MKLLWHIRLQLSGIAERVGHWLYVRGRSGCDRALIELTEIETGHRLDEPRPPQTWMLDEDLPF